MDVAPWDEALGRMRAALDRLETAVEKKLRVEAKRADVDEDLNLMQDDRARLAVELDGALADARTSAAANAAAANALARAASAIESVLARLAPPE